MKRNVAVLVLLAVLGLASFAAAQEPVEIRFFYPVQVAGPLAWTIDAMVAEFNAQHPNIRVQAIYSGNYDETMQRAQAAAMSGNPPEVAVLLAIDLLTLVNADLIIPLEDYLANDPAYRNDFVPGFMENSQYDGKIWSIPFQRSTPLLYYNKDMFREAGLDPEKPPTTWDELLEYAQKLTIRDQQGNVVRHGLTMVTEDTWMLQAFILQNGGEYNNEAGTEIYLDSPATIEALQFWVDLANKYGVMPRHRDYGEASADFAAEQSAMMYNSTGSLSFVLSSVNFDFGVAPLPGHKVQAVPTGGGNFYIFKGLTPEKEKAAWTFIKWMTSPEKVAEWSIASGYVPVRFSAFDEPRLKEYYTHFPQAAVASEQLAYARREMALHNNQQIRELVLTTIQEALEETFTVEQALSRAQRQADRILRAFQ